MLRTGSTSGATRWSASSVAARDSFGARLGRGIMIDHVTGVVIGETAVVEDGVSMLQGG